jgi:hypothetical protein
MQVWAWTDSQIRCVMCRSRNMEGRQPWTRSLAPSSSALFLVDYGVLQLGSGKEIEDSQCILCRFCSRDRWWIPICTDQREIARTRGGMLYASGTAVMIISSADPQMQRTLMFLQNSSATVAASASLWGEATVAPPACVIW